MSHWLACGGHELPEHTAWLAAAETARLARLRFDKRRTEYLLRRWTTKQAVRQAFDLDVDPARLAVLNRSSGAPYVLLDGEPIDADVSITDRAGRAVCLVGPGAVGVDLELVEPRSAGFVADFLTAAEAAWVRSRPEGESRDAAANLVWSAKESALKVLRTGLRADTRTVEVTLTGVDDDGAHDGTHDSTDDGTDDGWRRLAVRQLTTGRVLPGWWRRDGRFVLTTAATTTLPAPRRLPVTGPAPSPAAARPPRRAAAAPPG